MEHTAVADRPQALRLGAAVIVDLDEAAIHFHQLFQPDILGVGHDADRGGLRVAKPCAGEPWLRSLFGFKDDTSAAP